MYKQIKFIKCLQQIKLKSDLNKKLIQVKDCHKLSYAGFFTDRRRNKNVQNHLKRKDL